MSAMRNKYLGNIALILVIAFAWSFLIMDPAICPWLHNEAAAHHDHDGAELSVSNVSGTADLSLTESPHCDDIQISSMLVSTNVTNRPEGDRLSTQAFTQLDVETGTLLQVSSFLMPGSMPFARGDPQKIYLQNLSIIC